MDTKLFRKEKAQGMVEFALVLPMLLLVMFAVIEFGRLLFIWSAVFTASREAARYGAAAGSPGNYDPYYRDCAGMAAAARRISNLAGLSTITISYDHGVGNPIGSCPSNIPDVISLGDRVQVSVSTTYQPILPLVRIPPIPISSNASRTILKDISISGTPSAPTGSVTVFFQDATSAFNENADEVTVRVRLSALFAEDVWIPFSVTGGTATNGTDYTVLTPSPVLMRSGATQVDIHIRINQDSMYECHENVILSLGAPFNAGVSAPQTHTLSINDDDPVPSVSLTLSGQSVTEPNTGNSTTAQIIMQLSAVSGCSVSVPFSTDPANTTATHGTDYVYNTSSPVVIPAGQLMNHIDVRVIGDNLDEDDETVRVVMGTPVNATPGLITQHTVTILDDDLPPFVRFTWERQVVAESAGHVGIQVQLSAASGKTITVPYGVTGSATQGQDYGIQASPLVIAPGNSTANIPVNIYQDTLEEPDETITVTMGTPSNAFLGTPSVHTAVIQEQITPPLVYFDPSSQQVSEAAGEATVYVRLSKAYYQDVTVPFTIAGTATQGIDYQITGSPVVIRAGSDSVPIHITILNDTIDEVDEEIKLHMGTPINAIMDYPNISVTTIQDDDNPPVVYFVTQGEAVNETAGIVPVTVRLSKIAGMDVMVPFSVGGNAMQGSNNDYTLNPTSLLTIPAGYQQGTIDITVNNDDQPNGTNVGELDETIVLTLGTPINATRGTTYDVHTTTIKAWMCPTASSLYIDPGNNQRLVWQFDYSGTRTLNLTEVTVTWNKNGGVKMDLITFGSTIWDGSDNSGSLTVNTPNPLWSGTFTTRQMLFLFTKPPDPGMIVTAQFEHCRVYRN
jgi:hypothetical protein